MMRCKGGGNSAANKDDSGGVKEGGNNEAVEDGSSGDKEGGSNDDKGLPAAGSGSKRWRQ